MFLPSENGPEFKDTNPP